MINLKGKIINLLNKLIKSELDKKKIISIILASLILIYIDFAFLIKLQLRGIKNVAPNIIKLKKDIDTSTKDLSWMQNLKQKQAQRKEGVGQVKKIISEDKIPSLLEDISSIANKNNIKIMQIKPVKELKAKEDKTSKEMGKFKPLLITLDLSCNYHNFGKFLNNLENAGEFLVVQDLKMTRDAIDYLRQSVNLVLKTYVRK